MTLFVIGCVLAIFGALRFGFLARTRAARAAGGVVAVHVLGVGFAVTRGALTALPGVLFAAASLGVGVACWHAWRSGSPRRWRIRADGYVAFMVAASASIMADGLALVLAQPHHGLGLIMAVIAIGPLFWREMNAEEDAMMASRRGVR